MSLFSNLFTENSRSKTVLFSNSNPFFGSGATGNALPSEKEQDATPARRKKLKDKNVIVEAGKQVANAKAPAEVVFAMSSTKRQEDDTAKLPGDKGAENPLASNLAAGRSKAGKSARARDDHEGGSTAELQHPEKKKRKRAKQQVEVDHEHDEAEEELIADHRSTGQDSSPQPDGSHTTPEMLTRTVFVGNLPQSTVAKDLKKLFKRFGAVESVRIRSLAATPGVKMSKALQVRVGKTADSQDCINAYVLFSTTESADAAHALNMTEFNGHHIRVDKAAPPKKADSAGGVHYDSRRSVFVGNLPRDVKEEDLITIFNSGDEHPALDGAVEAVRVVRDHHCRVGKGIAYVLFRTKVAAMAALRMNGSKCGGREMRVMKVQSGGKQGTGGGGKKRLKDKQAPAGGAYKTKTKDGKTKSKDKSSSTSSSKKRTRDQKRPAVAARKMKAKLNV